MIFARLKKNLLIYIALFAILYLPQTTHALEEQILIDTKTSSTDEVGELWYFVDYTDKFEGNPDWFEWDSGKWWGSEFDPSAAGWEKGSLGIGYDIFGLDKWGWINTTFDPDPTETGRGQVWGIFGRIDFDAKEPDRYSRLFLDMDWEDSIHVWLNGVLVFSNDTSIPAPESGEGEEYFDKGSELTERSNNLGKGKAEPEYERISLSPYLNELKEGENTLAFMLNNSAFVPRLATLSGDLALGLRLSLSGEATDEEAMEVERERHFMVRVFINYWEMLKTPFVIIGLIVLFFIVALVTRHFYIIRE